MAPAPSCPRCDEPLTYITTAEKAEVHGCPGCGLIIDRRENEAKETQGHIGDIISLFRRKRFKSFSLPPYPYAEAVALPDSSLSIVLWSARAGSSGPVIGPLGLTA
jgi:hypothetical protein